MNALRTLQCLAALGVILGTAGRPVSAASTTDKEPAVLAGACLQHAGAVASVSWSPDGKTLASAAAGDKVRLWNVATGKESSAFGDPAAKACSVAWAPNGKLLASGHKDHTVSLWDVGAGTKATVDAVAFVQDWQVGWRG